MSCCRPCSHRPELPIDPKASSRKVLLPTQETGSRDDLHDRRPVLRPQRLACATRGVPPSLMRSTPIAPPARPT